MVRKEPRDRRPRSENMEGDATAVGQGRKLYEGFGHARELYGGWRFGRRAFHRGRCGAEVSLLHGVAVAQEGSGEGRGHPSSLFKVSKWVSS